jgi:hypothetical protein
MTSSDSLIQKQLIVRSLFDSKKCIDLRNDIYEYLFLDHIQVSARKNKKNLIEGMNRYLERIEDHDNDPHWAITYRYDVQLQATQCLQCGGFELIGGITNFTKLSHRVLCSCPGYIEWYEEIMAYLDRPLEIFM